RRAPVATDRRPAARGDVAKSQHDAPTQQRPPVVRQGWPARTCCGAMSCVAAGALALNGTPVAVFVILREHRAAPVHSTGESVPARSDFVNLRALVELMAT